jgi:hypothetical protein
MTLRLRGEVLHLPRMATVNLVCERSRAPLDSTWAERASLEVIRRLARHGRDNAHGTRIALAPVRVSCFNCDK